MDKKILTAERAKELLDYDPCTGNFYRKVALTNSVKIGDIAGSKNQKGYLEIWVDGKRYYAHRLAWLIETGEFPKEQIDHINCVKTDNRIANLRCVSDSINKQNKREALDKNTSGLLGVSWMAKAKKWKAQIQLNKTVIYLGLFEDKKQAHNAYVQAKRSLHEGCTI